MKVSHTCVFPIREGFAGTQCACIEASCGGSIGAGQCDDSQPNACICNTGWGGLNCSCNQSTCKHGAHNGACDPSSSTGACICAVGFGGGTCLCNAAAQDVNVGCFGHGTCENDFECNCDATWFGHHCNCNEALTWFFLLLLGFSFPMSHSIYLSIVTIKHATPTQVVVCAQPAGVESIASAILLWVLVFW